MILKNKNQNEWVKLKNVLNAYEMDLISAMLAQFDIPVLKKSKGAGAYTSVYMGMSITGYDIYVPANRLEDAKEILQSEEIIVDPIPLEDTDVRTVDNPGGYILHYRELFKKLLVIFFIIPGMIALIYVLYQYLIKIFE